MMQELSVQENGPFLGWTQSMEANLQADHKAGCQAP